MAEQQEGADGPLEIEVDGAVIVVKGPAGLVARLTKGAALASAKRLQEAAGAAEEIYQKPLG